MFQCSNKALTEEAALPRGPDVQDEAVGARPVLRRQREAFAVERRCRARRRRLCRDVADLQTKLPSQAFRLDVHFAHFSCISKSAQNRNLSRPIRASPHSFPKGEAIARAVP